MSLFNFMLLSLFLLLPFQKSLNFGPEAVSCDYAPSMDPRKKGDFGENFMSASYCKKDQEEPFRDNNEPLVMNVGYDTEKDENAVTVEEKKENLRQVENSSPEFEAVKEAGVKVHAKKGKAQDKGVPKSGDKVVKIEFARHERHEFPCSKRRNVMSAECEQCELQVKANGDGVMLRCRDCREVPSTEISFPPGSNRKIIRLP